MNHPLLLTIYRIVSIPKAMTLTMEIDVLDIGLWFMTIDLTRKKLEIIDFDK